MFRFDESLKVYLHRDAVDFRKSINGLSVLVEQSMKHDPFARTVYGFRNKRCDRIKLLLYERNGFWLMMKRLEADCFFWPRHGEVVELGVGQLHWLLEGIDLAAMRKHPDRHYALT
jgi:transposase